MEGRSQLALLIVLHTLIPGCSLLLLNNESPFFSKVAWLDHISTNQKNYGVAVVDVNHDGRPDFVVAGYSGPNFVFTYDNATGRASNIALEGTPFESLRDVPGNAIGVAACDIDGDGKEEIYFLNTNQAYAGRAAYGDKIFKWRDGRYVDLYSDPHNINMPAKGFAGRSVACVDRKGTGKYAFVVATYSYQSQGAFALVEMDEAASDLNTGIIKLRNVGEEAGIARSTGGRGIVVGPILGNNGVSDIFFGNEGNRRMFNAGANFLFRNLGNGTFQDVADSTGVLDGNENVRGIALADFNRDGYVDIAYGNWDGPHRLYIQKRDNGTVTFENVATGSYATPTPIRTVIAADFDNDGILEVLQNNIFYRSQQPNKLFKIVPENGQIDIQTLNIGDALEPEGYGTGGAVTDFNGDGKLDLMLSHGEGNSQPLTVFTVNPGNNNNWIRIQPRTQFGAPARGAAVKVTSSAGTNHLHVIDGGSGYLCEMEPYAHVGLGTETPTQLTVQWPDGTSSTRVLTTTDMNKVHIVDKPSQSSEGTMGEFAAGGDCPSGKWKAQQYQDLPVLCEGDRVNRGPGWTWTDENRGGAGVVMDGADSSYISYYIQRGDPYWVLVRWDVNGLTLPYRMGSRGQQDLCRCRDCGRTPECQCSC